MYTPKQRWVHTEISDSYTYYEGWVHPRLPFLLTWNFLVYLESLTYFAMRSKLTTRVQFLYLQFYSHQFKQQFPGYCRSSAPVPFSEVKPHIPDTLIHLVSHPQIPRPPGLICTFYLACIKDLCFTCTAIWVLTSAQTHVCLTPEPHRMVPSLHCQIPTRALFSQPLVCLLFLFFSFSQLQLLKSRESKLSLVPICLSSFMIMIYVCLLKIYLESYSPMTSYRTLMNLALRFRAMIHLKVNVVQNVR